ncbi:MAG: hypothetical protein ACE14L_05640 [Terriglobales bacterium]
MDDAARNVVAECLECLADHQDWNPALWKRCYELVKAHGENELPEYVRDDLIHYAGEFHSRNILGIRVKSDRYQLEQYRQEFRDVASAL